MKVKLAWSNIKTSKYIYLLTLLLLALPACTTPKTADRTSAPTVSIISPNQNSASINQTEEYEIESVAENLHVPWSILFTSSTRILVTERKGTIRVIENGQLQSTPLLTFTEVTSRSEEGLMGLAKDPNYEHNGYLYVCLAYEKNSRIVDKIIKIYDPSRMSVPNPNPPQEILLDNIPAALNHAGCRLEFGPDGKLYATTGDATNKQIAQDLNSLGGKILRLNSDGTIPSDNPFPNSLIYSYGHRNPQGISWHPSGQLWATEHGPSGNDGPGGGDEINLITTGKNYGWPIVSHEKSQSGMENPALIFTPAVAPASALIYTGDKLPQFKNKLLFGALRGEAIHIASLNDQGTAVVSHNKLDMQGMDLGRIRAITQGPDECIYFTTSNTDGRGRKRTGDDHIYRIKPQSASCT